MAYKVKKSKLQKRDESNDELIDSFMNGNRIYVREKFKGMRQENKGLFLGQAKYRLSQKDYDDLVRSLYK
jgi:hypothetical protein